MAAKGRWSRIATFMGLAGVLAVLSSCAAGTEFSSKVVGATQGQRYQQVAVLVQSADFAFSKKAGEAVEDQASDNAVHCVSAFKFMKGGVVYSWGELYDLLAYEGVDALIIVTPGKTGSAQVRMPATSTTYVVPTDAGLTSTTLHNDGTIHKLWAQYTVEVRDTHTAETVWQANAFTGGNAFAGESDLIRSLAGKIVDQLVTDGLVQAGKKPVRPWGGITR